MKETKFMFKNIIIFITFFSINHRIFCMQKDEALRQNALALLNFKVNYNTIKHKLPSTERKSVEQQPTPLDLFPLLLPNSSDGSQVNVTNSEIENNILVNSFFNNDNAGEQPSVQKHQWSCTC